MMKAANDVLSRALELPPKERTRIARKLLESVADDSDESPGLDAELAKELEQRLKDKAPRGGWPTLDEVLDEASREHALPRRRTHSRSGSLAS